MLVVVSDSSAVRNLHAAAATAGRMTKTAAAAVVLIAAVAETAQGEVHPGNCTSRTRRAIDV